MQINYMNNINYIIFISSTFCVCETHNALQFPVLFFFSLLYQCYPEYQGIRSKKLFYRPSKS